MKVSKSFIVSASREVEGGKLKDKHKLTSLFVLLVSQLKKFIIIPALDNLDPDQARQVISKNSNLNISSYKLCYKKSLFSKSTYIMYSTLSTNKELVSMDLSSPLNAGAATLDDEINNFYTWFAGFTDAEGYFYIATSSSKCSFRFQINLHKDDTDVLYFIHKNLGFGEVRSFVNYSSFTVTRLKDIKNLLLIFSRYPLQGSKWLNYKDFAKAFELYTSSRVDSNLLKEILEIKNGMNKSRSDYTLLKEIKITPYWLLGFIEGEGCFSINKGNSYRLDFSLSQAYSNMELMKKIKNYLENLPNTMGNYSDALGLSIVKHSNTNHQATVRIETTRIAYITNILIPFLENLAWHSKKQLDFQDWKNILMLKEQGHHFSEQGVKLIDRILSQMNKNRLSTNTKVLKSNEDRSSLLAEVKEMLNGPSNFEIKNGRKFIVSLNKYYKSSRKNSNVDILDSKGNILHSFESLADCAAYLKVHPSTISKRIIHNIPFSLENEQVYVKKSEK